MRYGLVIILLLYSYSFLGQKYNFRNFEKEKVKAKYIYDFAQDADGVLYAATSKGLLIYDGVSFRLLDKYSLLKDNFVSKIHIAANNEIWLTYYENGLTKLKKSFKGLEAEHYDTDVVSSIFENKDGLSILTTEFKEGYYDSTSNSFEYSINELSELKLRERVKLKNGKIIYLSQDGIYFKNNKRFQLLPETEFEYIKLLKTNPTSNNFVFELNGKLYIYQLNDKLRLVNTVDLNKIGITTKITDLAFVKDKLVISTLGQGLFEIKFIDQRLQAYNFINYNVQNGLLSNFIQSLFYDHEQNLWIGYYGDGISVFTSKKTLWYDESTGLTNENILCVTNYKGDLVVGTDKGFSIIRVDTIINYNENTGFYNDRVKSILAKDNRLWIGTESHGLFYLENGVLTAFNFDDQQFVPKSINYILNTNDKLYLGTNTGLYIKSFTDGKELHIGTNEGLVHNVIEYIYLDSKGRFWFDSPVSPIYSYKDGEFTLYKDLEGFESFELSQIFETADKEIIFSTMGDGIFILKNGEFNQYRTQNSGILSNYVYFVVEDINHQIWMGHKDGLSRLNLENKTFDQFNKKDNPLLKGVNTTAYQLSADNKLWIGTENGLIKIDNGVLSTQKQFPPVIYKGMAIDDSIIAYDSIIELPYSDYQLEFKFQSIYLTNPKEVTYQYKLEGFDKHWNTVAYDKLLARYQSIIDGNYVFRLKVCLEDSCSEKEIKIKIIVKKPFWKTSSALIIFVLLIITLFVGTVYWINARRIKLMRVLELKVQRRTLELSKANRLVEQKNEALLNVNEKVVNQKKILELKNREIDDSIKYAKRIQRAFVFKDDYAEWRSLFKTTVMLDKPRDIVSGDFYWGSKNQNFIYLAVGDCTGHGVPGAMLSMLGVAFLDEIMLDHPEIETNELLGKLRTKVIHELVHETDEFAMKEGMDITLLRINLETLEMQWSGANNPLYIIRKTTAQSEQLKEYKNITSGAYTLTEIRADKQPIGYLHQLKPFTQHNVQLQKEDAIYLTTDGYVDQFGGERYKKFMSKRLKPLLIDIHAKSEKEQYQILNQTFMNWMGDGDQIDDVLIAGLVI
ncbi:MAG: SpoIIE family protein phosphatase [Flavobacteriales bacterium]|nr:SpoIIE family protein phosphatase [Flavobacteriales bacterium]